MDDGENMAAIIGGIIETKKAFVWQFIECKHDSSFYMRQ